MKSSTLLEKLETQLGYKPTQTEIAKIIGLKQGVIATRVARDSRFSTEEIEKIALHFAINLYDNLPTNDIELDFYQDIEASCGNGILPFSEAKEKISVTKDLITKYNKDNEYFVIKATSDSMTPQIMPKDLLIIRKCEQESIIDNHIYIFCYKDKLYCKYLSDNLGQIIVRSSNKDYSTRIIEGEELNNFNLIGEVIGQIREYLK